DVLTTLIGMMNDAVGTSVRDRHVQCCGHQLCSEVRRHRPTYDLAAPDIENNCKIKKAGPRRHVRDVGDPERVRLVGHEVPIDQVRGRPPFRRGIIPSLPVTIGSAVGPPWWVRTRVESHAVPDLATLRAWAVQGRFDRYDLVCRPDESEWIAARNVPELRSQFYPFWGARWKYDLFLRIWPI